MSDWLDDFQMMGVGLNEGEKTLMRLAISRERKRFARIANTMLDKETAEDIIFLVNDVNVI